MSSNDSAHKPLATSSFQNPRPPAWAVFTDGSCWAKDRIGGWAWVAYSTTSRKAEKSEGVRDTTISRMELAAPIDFLRWLMDCQGPSWVLVHSDSEYVVKGATDRTRARNCHIDLWDELDQLIDDHDEVQFEHVKGHHVSYYNTKADQLAGEARKSLRNELA